ncbi:MAG: helix-turn-helix transcriptional regulator [Thiobacillaceae bacterium]
MVSDKLQDSLARLGTRLREARLARNESQGRFAARIGVSIPTLRRLEQGDPNTQIGHWLEALELLGRLDDVDALLAPSVSLFDAAAAPKTRQRARRRV